MLSFFANFQTALHSGRMAFLGMVNRPHSMPLPTFSVVGFELRLTRRTASAARPIGFVRFPSGCLLAALPWAVSNQFDSDRSLVRCEATVSTISRVVCLQQDDLLESRHSSQFSRRIRT